MKKNNFSYKNIRNLIACGLATVLVVSYLANAIASVVKPIIANQNTTTNYSIEQVSSESSTTTNAVHSEEINNLINSVKVEEANNDAYNRDDWVAAQKYIFQGRTYDSIRRYSFDASVWNNGHNYVDPYTGNDLKLKNTDYDHIIPLAYANAHGASNWTDEQKQAFANDPDVGVCVSSHDNRQKGAKGPSEWMPSSHKAEYCYTWLVIANKYHLSISKADMDVIIATLSNVDSVDIINNRY